MHSQFKKTMSQFYETGRPSEQQTFLGLWDKAQLREDTGYVNEHYTDTRPIYMPPVANNIMHKIQSDLKLKLKQQEKALKRQQLADKKQELGMSLKSQFEYQMKQLDLNGEKAR